MTAARKPLAALGVIVALVALVVQLAGDALYANAAVVPSLPHVFAGDWPFDLAARTGLDRFPAVRVELARGAIARGEAERATALLAPLPPSSTVIDLRGRVALLQNDSRLALADFADAGDFIAGESALVLLRASDPAAALAIAHDFELRLGAKAAEPEIMAEVDFFEGEIAATAMQRYPAAAERYGRMSLDAFARALELAPNDEKYLLNYAFAALRNGDVEVARKTYERAAQVVPNSADAFAGIALAAADLGDCPASRRALVQARRFHPQAVPPLFVLADYAPEIRAAFTRCNP